MIEKLINDYLLNQQAERAKRERSGMWSPSSFGRCFRFQFWNRKNEPQSNPPDARALRIFKVGDLFHKFVGELLPQAQLEVLVKQDDILGFADIVLDDCVIDIKSQHSKSFWYMEKSNYDIVKEKKPNILQTACYAWILNKPKFNLCFLSKDDLCVAEYGFVTSRWIAEVEAELKTLRGFWNEDKLPPAEPRCYAGKECVYCPFRDKCFKLEGKTLLTKKEA